MTVHNHERCVVCQSTRATYLLCEQENVVHQDEEALLLARVAPLLQQPSLEALAVRARIAQQLRGGGGLLADECLTNLHDPAEVCFKFFLLHLQSLRLELLQVVQHVADLGLHAALGPVEHADRAVVRVVRA